LSAEARVLVPGTYDFIDDYLVPGDGNLHLESRILFGQTIVKNNYNFFINSELAYRSRLGHSGDQVRGEFTLGESHKKHLFAFQNFLTYSVASLNDTVFNHNLLRSGGYYAFAFNTKDYIQFSYLKDVWGENVLLGQLLILSWWRTF
jgi:hypothetical protein